MHEWQSLSHVRWDCKYHIVIIPKFRKRVLYGRFRKRVGEVVQELCRQRGIKVVEGHLMPTSLREEIHWKGMSVDKKVFHSSG